MSPGKRIVFVDALRGFALSGIVLIHFVEHFDFFYPPEVNYFFSPETDQTVMDIVLFLISGKAYSIFALTFGFSFFIQLNRREQNGIDFRGRFAWRLAILFFIGFVHSLIYRGDILHIYAILGFPLIFMYKLKDKTLAAIAILLVIEIPILYSLVLSFIDPTYTFVPDYGGNWFSEAEAIYANGSFWDVVKINVWKSRYLVYAWTYYTGRLVQLVALFIVGLMIGRKRYFENIANYKRQAIQILVVSVILIFAFQVSANLIGYAGFSELQVDLLSNLIKAFSNLAYTAAIVTIFILVYLTFKKSPVFELLAAYGKMSLTNYVSQAVFGVVFYFSFGLGMWRYMGSTWSLLFGFCFFILQILFSKYWLKHFYYGPLEWLWRALTFMDFGLKMKRG
jgi:uncharacterized protein